MRFSIPYLYQEQPMDSLTVDDAGNCAISAYNDDGELYLLIVITKYGVTRLLEYGPFRGGSRVTYCSCVFDQFDYNEKKLFKKFEKFLNNPSRMITQASCSNIDDLDLDALIINPLRYMFDA